MCMRFASNFNLADTGRRPAGGCILHVHGDKSDKTKLAARRSDERLSAAGGSAGVGLSGGARR